MFKSDEKVSDIEDYENDECNVECLNKMVKNF